MKIYKKLLAISIFALTLCFALSVHASVWQSTSSLNTTRGAAGIIEINGHIYAIGGIDGTRFLSTSEYTKINDDGSLASWQETTTLNEDRGFFGVAEHNGYIYAVGGGNGPNGHNLLRTVERAKVLEDGGLGPWQTEAHLMNVKRRCSKILIQGNYIYAFGGFGGNLLNSIERAQINSDGTLGKWELLEQSFRIPRYIHDMAVTDKGFYAIGGHAKVGGNGISDVEFSTFQTEGNITRWQAGNKLNQGRYGLSAKHHNGYIYAMGGLNGATFYDIIERSRINNDGTLSQWETVSPLPAPFADIGVTTYKDWIYIIGGTNRDGYYDSVFMARVEDLSNPAPTNTTKQQITKAPKPSKPVYMPNKGSVLEIIDGGTYSYIKIDLGGGEHEWLATSKVNVKIGDTVHYSLGILMQDFYSRALNRTFKLIRFVGKLEKLPDGWN